MVLYMKIYTCTCEQCKYVKNKRKNRKWKKKMNQDKLYKKVGRKYVEISMPERFDMQDGVWLVQSAPGWKSMSSLYWKVGDLKRPAVVTQTVQMEIDI